MALRPELPLRILMHEKNLGQSRAMRTGVRAAKSDLVVTLDGDGQNDPADIPKLLSLFRQHAGDPAFAMIAGERTKRQDSWSKKVASRLANRIRRGALGDTATDTGCSLKAFKRDIYLVLPYFDHMHRYLIALIQRHGGKVGFAPVNHRPRIAGRSKYTNLGRTLVSIYDMLGVRWLQRRHGGRTKTEEL
jgi:glycosyltransferase involved in cell wall biosynthesis